MSGVDKIAEWFLQIEQEIDAFQDGILHENLADADLKLKKAQAYFAAEGTQGDRMMTADSDDAVYDIRRQRAESLAKWKGALKRIDLLHAKIDVARSVMSTKRKELEMLPGIEG